jgi:rhodanese-related sulfurtransferase
MDVAVPSNFNCGVARAEPGAPVSLDQSWAPITLSPVGVPEVLGDWLRSHLPEVVVLDVREPDEFRGELGHIVGAELSPLQALTVATAALPRDRPVVTVCRSGGRSGKAALSLLGLGFARVASLAGGMTAWNAQGLPVEYGAAASHRPGRQG